MDHRLFFRSLAPLLFLMIVLIFSGCSKKDSSEASSTFTPGSAHVLVPEADGSKTIGGDPLLLDLSHTDQGYFIGTMSEDGGKINLQLIGPDSVTYKYFIEEAGCPTVFPFTAGSGSYTVMAFQNISGDRYASLFSQVIDVELENDFLPFLYPNQYVDFTADSQAVALAARLTDGLTSDVDALTAIYEYVTANITYDNEKAATVSGNYLPDIDETLSTGKGICFDYASLTAAMLRSVGIPAKLAIGYTASVRHAWIDVYIQSVGWVERAVEFNGDEWKLMDPTFAAAETDQDLQEYIGDGDNYITEYVR